jgi:epsin
MEGDVLTCHLQTVRVAAKELTALILDDERLRAERSDRKSWKSRVTGLEEYAPQHAEPSNARRPRERRAPLNEEEDAEYKLALEASKYQEEEDRKKRESRRPDDVDDDLAKAIKLSQEEDERRRRELEDSNENSLFDVDDTPQPSTSSQPQFTGFNQGYQQGNQVDFFANPVEQSQMMNQQPTGFMNNAYTGYPQSQPTGFQPNYNFGMQPTGVGMDPYGQQQNVANMTAFQQQPTGFNPYAQQVPQQPQQSSEPGLQAGSNNPWATNKAQQQQSLMPTPTGSNNPFAQNNRPQASKPISTLGSLPEQKTLSAFNNQPMMQQQPLQQSQLSVNPPPQKQMNDYQSKLNNLLATGDGMDTYGNTGELRIPAQHTAPGMFANSAGSGVQRLGADATGNPYMRQQFTGMPGVTYGTQPANGQGSNNPFGARPQQQQPHQGQGQDLIQF